MTVILKKNHTLFDLWRIWFDGT